MEEIDLMKELELPEEPKQDPGVFQVREYPDDMLQVKCLPWVTDVAGDAELQDHIDSMENTLKVYRAAGISGPQVGIPYRVISIATKNDKVLTMINPVITRVYGETKGGTEGCLSFPGLFMKVKRYASIEATFVDRKGNVVNGIFIDEQARAVQHEIDHLDGVVFIDRIPKVMRSEAVRKWKLAPRAAKQRQKQFEKMFRGFQAQQKKAPVVPDLAEETMIPAGGALTQEAIEAASERLVERAGQPTPPPVLTHPDTFA